MGMNSKLKWMNLTPHDVNIIAEECTVQDRNGRINLRREFDADKVSVLCINPEPRPLTVHDGSCPCGLVDNISFYSPIANAGFNQMLNSAQIEQMDVIIVSQKCAGLINANIPFVQSGVQNSPLDLVSADKFYIPGQLVYQDGRPVGALGLQKVTTYLPLPYYAGAIQNGRRVSLPGLFQVCSMYCALPDYQRRDIMNSYMVQMEESLKIANKYIFQFGYQTYREL